MESKLTVEELETRWEKALEATRCAAALHPATYRQLKALAADVLDHPIDINDYFPTVEQLTGYLNTLDPCHHGSIFDFFHARISPGDVWQVRNLRMECKDLLAHLDAFDRWRRKKSHLRMIK